MPSVLSPATFRRAGLVALLALGTALPAAAFDIKAMTPAEKEAFGEAVREYLIENPEVLIEVSQALESRQYAQQAEADVQLLKDNHDAIFADGYSWVGGNPQGDITLVEFMDYRCGYCRKSNPEVEELVRSDGNIRFIVKEFPILGEASVISSKFAIAVQQIAGDDAYKAAHDALIELRGEPTEATLAALAKELGLDADAIMSRLDAPEVQAVIEKNHALAEALQIQGTPTFVLGDTMLRGYVPLDGMRKIVAGERS